MAEITGRREFLHSRRPLIAPTFKILLRFLIPTATASDLRKAAWLALAGALMAGTFGIIHDQITYSISPEYFTRMKFIQFHVWDFGFPRRVFVAEIGFLATWWVGLIAGWFLARIALPKFKSPGSRVLKAIGIIVAVTLAFGISGYFLGPIIFADRAGSDEALNEMGVTQNREFQQVAGIHLGSYAGALLGWLGMMVVFFKRSGDR